MAFVLRSAKPITLSTCPQAISGAILALFFSLPVWADITGKVVAISDGDTITILDASKTQHKIRIAGMPATAACSAPVLRTRAARELWSVSLLLRAGSVLIFPAMLPRTTDDC